jgi:hypothetical protein
MNEETKVTKHEPQHSSKVLRELRDNVPKSVVAALLTILGALAFNGAVITFNFSADEKQITERLEFERNRDINLAQNELMIRDAFSKMVPVAHAKLMGEFQSAIPTMTDAKRVQFAKRLFAAVGEANGNLGTLEGYAGLESAIPPNWLPSQIEYLSADLDTLQTALSCTEQSLETRNAKLKCLLSMGRQGPRVERAVQRSQAAGKAATAAKTIFEADRTHRWAVGKSELDSFFRRSKWAFDGLMLSLMGYAVLFHFFLLSK